MPLVLTRLGISCLTIINIIPTLFLIFVCFQKLNRCTGALPTIEWSPGTKAKFGAVLTLEYMSKEESDPKHPQRKRTVIPLKRQLDEHETAMSIAKGKGVRQPVEGTRRIG